MSKLGDFIRRTKRNAGANAGVKKVPANITNEQIKALNNGTGVVMFKNGKAILKKKPKKAVWISND